MIALTLYLLGVVTMAAWLFDLDRRRRGAEARRFACFVAGFAWPVIAGVGLVGALALQLRSLTR